MSENTFLIRHLRVNIKDDESSVYGYTMSALVAWLKACHRRGSIANAARFYGVSLYPSYYRIWRLEQMMEKRMYVRWQRPFTLTEAGRNIINEYS